ncbi:MAG: GNAT family N-acetyltransferase [Bacteroidales bacterium]|nr:GNAT family N-acetyltransferase [Bacteroidales bacterium]
MNFKTYNPADPATLLEKQTIMRFLFKHLDEFGDSEQSIMNAIEYAMSPQPSAGGFILLAIDNDQITGAVVMNRTGMQGYIPENILVYIAVHHDHRGEGLGKELMKRTIDTAKGDIALHVEPDNPARYLYEKFHFTNKYLEMRLIKTAS